MEGDGLIMSPTPSTTGGGKASVTSPSGGGKGQRDSSSFSGSITKLDLSFNEMSTGSSNITKLPTVSENAELRQFRQIELAKVYIGLLNTHQLNLLSIMIDNQAAYTSTTVGSFTGKLAITRMFEQEFVTYPEVTWKPYGNFVFKGNDSVEFDFIVTYGNKSGNTIVSTNEEDGNEDDDEEVEAEESAPAAAAPAAAVDDMTPTPPRIGSTKLRFNDYGKIERIIDRTRRLKDDDKLKVQNPF